MRSLRRPLVALVAAALVAAPASPAPARRVDRAIQYAPA